MEEEMKQIIIKFIKTYFETAGYPAVHVKVKRVDETIHKLYISKKNVTILFKFDKKTMIVKYNENNKEFIYDIGDVLKTMIILL